MEISKESTKNNEMQADEWRKYILTPASKQGYAQSVHSTKGDVLNSENILQNDGRSARISFTYGGEKPYLILDLGPASPGGYPVFKVTGKTGCPVVRISYSDWFDYIVDPVYGEQGDFSKGSAAYLGVELPVPPANPYRYELYTVNHTGKFVATMIQGQQRWVRIQLDTESTSVEIECFYIENISDMSSYAGHFISSDEDLNRLWYASTYTAQIASYENADAWVIVGGWLIPRKLAKSNEVGLSVQGDDWTDYSFEFDFMIRKNPGPVSSVGWVLRAQGENDCYIG